MRTALIIIFLMSFTTLANDEFYWVTKSGERAPETPSQKSLNGFGGWLLVTPDKDWQAKWDTPREHTPSFNEAKKVKLGEELTILPFFSNPKLTKDKKFEILCDIRVEQPNGEPSIDEKNIPCASGEIHDDPRAVYLTHAVIKYIGEPGDKFGEWKVYVNLLDKNRGVSLNLMSSFELVQ